VEFIDTTIVASIRKLGVAQLDVIAGKSLKIETSPQGEEVFNIKVPIGKVWHVEISVLITETDV